jgi:hypothetical protein
MKVLNLLVLLNITTPFICSVDWGHKYDGWAGALIGLVVGLVISAGNFFAIRAVGKACWRYGMRCKEQNRSMYWPTQVMRGLYFAAGLWICTSSLLAIFITKSVIYW